jgi:hypothetical protein
MLLVVKLLIVAFGVFGQGQLLPDRESPVASALDTLAFPLDHPEWVLARRAMASEGLCHPGHSVSADTGLATDGGDAGEDKILDYTLVRLVADACE